MRLPWLSATPIAVGSGRINRSSAARPGGSTPFFWGAGSPPSHECGGGIHHRVGWSAKACSPLQPLLFPRGKKFFPGRILSGVKRCLRRRGAAGRHPAESLSRARVFPEQWISGYPRAVTRIIVFLSPRENVLFTVVYKDYHRDILFFLSTHKE